MSNKKAKHSPVVILLNIIILILCVVLVGAVFGTMSEFRTYDRNWVKEESYIWRLQDNDYSGLLNVYNSDKGKTENYREYRAVAEYVKASFYYKAFAETGDTVRAQKYQEQMRQKAEEMGDLVIMQETIDQKFSELK